MSASRRSTADFSADKVPISDMARVDLHEIKQREYEEAPDLADRALAEGVLEIGGLPARRGRPAKADRKLSTTLRLDPDVLAHFKMAGPGWQGRINAALRKCMTSESDGKARYR